MQPIALKDMKGMKIYDFILEAHQKGKEIPRIAKQASTKTDGMPEPGSWANPVEDMIIQVE